MDEQRFDRWTARLGEALTRRDVSGLAIGAMAALGLTAAQARKKRKKARPCKPATRVKTCADTCGTVANNCKKPVDCGPCEGFVFERMWGLPGVGTGQFALPYGIAVDGLGNVYVADSGNNRIQKFDNNGRHLLTWGRDGSGNGQFNSPEGIAVNGAGDIFVADTHNHRVQKFTATGGYVSQWNSDGSAGSEFFYPNAIAVDTAGNVYLSTATDEFDYYGVRVFSSGGTFLNRLDDSEITAKSHLGLSVFGSTVYASYEISGRSLVEKIGPAGTLLGTIGSRGSGEGQLAVPRGLAHDAAGNLYVTDSANNRIQIFDPADAVLDVIGSGGKGEGEFSLPRGVALDTNGNVFVIDSLNNRVQKFRPAGTARRGRASSRHGPGALRRRRGRPRHGRR